MWNRAWGEFFKILLNFTLVAFCCILSEELSVQDSTVDTQNLCENGILCKLFYSQPSGHVYIKMFYFNITFDCVIL